MIFPMKALHFNTSLTTINDYPVPATQQDDVLIQVSSTGICNTDIEITRGYIPGFNGIPGHEFIGFVESGPENLLANLRGKRVTAEINCGCGVCDYCRRDLSRHCPDRTVIGIDKRNGAFAEYISVPAGNIITIPDTISDNNALFMEPLAAALEIQEQISIRPDSNVLLLGDGKLAHLIALTLKPVVCQFTVAGKHARKTDLLQQQGITTTLIHHTLPDHSFDIVIEASGSPAAFDEALRKVRPRGTVILKSTYANGFQFNPAAVVVNEITLLGSRCGRFRRAIDFLENNSVDFTYLISKRFPLSDGITAFSAAQQSNIMKVVIDCRR